VNRHPILSAVAQNASRLGLSRMRSFLDHLGGPLGTYPIIHVAGTNGKGSVIQLLSSILQEAGYRVGAYTSPHLQRLNERIKIDGVEISDPDLDALLHGLEATRERWAREIGGGVADSEATLNFFELLTAAGLLHMGRAGVDIGLVEVGLGGRLDATNLVDPLVSVIVTVSLDHRDRLGPDIASIASEKAGVIKPGRPIVVGPLPSDALKVIRLTAVERDAPLIVSGEDFRTLRSEGGHLSWTCGGQTLRDLPLGLPGEHQVENAGVALAVLQAISEKLPVDEAHIRTGLASARHPGRLERLADDLLIDSAHNGDGAATLARYLAALPRDRPRTLVLGTSVGKDIRAMGVLLAPQVDTILTTHCTHPRAATAADIAAALVGVDLPILPAGPIEQALPLARDGRSLVIVAGSVHIAGAARDIFEGRWHDE
jgi:dihydrofolate synthase/folylpolyglutamate synthase